MIVVGRMILSFAVMGAMFKEVKTEKPKTTGQEKMMVMESHRRRLKEFERIRHDVHQGSGHQGSGAKRQHRSTISVQPQSEIAAAECE